MTLKEALQNRNSLYEEQIIVLYKEYCESSDTPVLRFWMIRANQHNQLRLYSLNCTPRATQAAFEDWWDYEGQAGKLLDGIHDRYREATWWKVMEPDQFIPWVHQLYNYNVRPPR